MPEDVWAVARPRLESLTGESVREAAFVDDALVDYGTPERIYVRRTTLFALEAHEEWARFLGEGDEPPSWLHLNLLGGPTAYRWSRFVAAAGSLVAPR